MLKKQEDFSQVLKNELVLSGYSSGAIRCDFVKTVSRNSIKTDYNSYIVVKRIDGNYFIVGESDLNTDRNIKHEPDLGTKLTIRDGKFEVGVAGGSKRNLTIIIATSLVVVL